MVTHQFSRKKKCCYSSCFYCQCNVPVCFYGCNGDDEVLLVIFVAITRWVCVDSLGVLLNRTLYHVCSRWDADLPVLSVFQETNRNVVLN